MALWRRRRTVDLIYHSGRGIQCACEDYQDLLDQTALVRSMSRKGDCWGNAGAKRPLGPLKRGRTDGHLYVTTGEAKQDVMDYIEMFYNSRCRHWGLGYLGPNQFEAAARVV